MPDTPVISTPTPTNDAGTIPDASLSEADRHAEMLAQRARSGDPQLTEKPSLDPARESELDRNLEEVLAGTNPDGTPKTDPEPKPAEPAADPEPKPAEPAADPKPKGPLSNLVVEAAKSTDPKPEGAQPPADPFDEVKLRSDASQKTRETFDNLKRVASERLTAANAKVTELEAKLADVEKRLGEQSQQSQQVPEAVQKELEELRAFRLQFDTENDPAFRQRHDGKIEANYNAVYEQLKGLGLPDDQLGLLKAMQPADRDAAIDRLLEANHDKIPTATKRFIEAKLVENISAADARKKELEEIRSNSAKVLEERKAQTQAQSQQRIDEISKTLRPSLAALPWIHTKEIPATAGSEEKKALEAHNQFAISMQQALRTAILDDSPQTRAEAALAVPLAHFFERAYKATNARLEAALAELEGIRKAGRTSRTAQSSASPRAGTPAATPAKAQPENSGDAVDALFNELSANPPTR